MILPVSAGATFFFVASGYLTGRMVRKNGQYARTAHCRGQRGEESSRVNNAPEDGG
jgi:uncharacterized protein YgiB involved in biofilm formation